MRTVIYKYVLPIQDRFTLELPKGTLILSLQTQNNLPCIWALVEKDCTEKVTRSFSTEATGTEIKIEEGKSKEYIGTYQVPTSSHHSAPIFVGHVFEIITFPKSPEDKKSS